MSSTLGGGSFGRDPNNLTNASGRLPNDRPHMLRGAVSWQVNETGATLNRALVGQPVADQWPSTSLFSAWAGDCADADPEDYNIATVRDLVAGREDPWGDIDAKAQSIERLLDMVKADEERGLGDLPYPPNYPKMPGEPKRVQPSRDTDRKRE